MVAGVETAKQQKYLDTGKTIKTIVEQYKRRDAFLLIKKCISVRGTEAKRSQYSEELKSHDIDQEGGNCIDTYQLYRRQYEPS